MEIDWKYIIHRIKRKYKYIIKILQKKKRRREDIVHKLLL